MSKQQCCLRGAGTLAALALLLLAGSAGAQERKTLVNQKYVFQVSYPADWKVERTMHPDPFPKIEDFKAGRAKLSGGIQIGGERQEPADWNAAWFNQIQTGPPPGVPYSPSVPSILVYAHPAAAMSFEEFTAYFKEFVGLFRMEVVLAGRVKTAGGMEGYEYVYKMGPVPTRVAIFFANGKRYGLMYFEPEQKDFDRFEQPFGELVRSFQILAAPSGPAR